MGWGAASAEPMRAVPPKEQCPSQWRCTFGQVWDMHSGSDGAVPVETALSSLESWAQPVKSRELCRVPWGSP